MNSNQLAIRAVASSVVDRQGWLANSPGQMGADGVFRLCAAACLVYAEIATKKSIQEAEAYLSRLQVLNSKDFVFTKAHELGLNTDLLNRVMIANDSVDSTQRGQVLENSIGLVSSG
jgi:hypothetical protein